MRFFCVVAQFELRRRRNGNATSLLLAKPGQSSKTVANNSNFLEAALSGDITPPREPAMSETADSNAATKSKPVSRARRHPVILRVSSLAVAGVLALLLL